MIINQGLITQKPKSPDSSGAYLRIDIQIGKDNKRNVDYAGVHYV